MTDSSQFDVPPRPERPVSVAAEPNGSWVPIVLGGCALALAVLLLYFLTGGFFLVVVFMALLIGGFAAVHYVVWGWWLGKLIEREEDPSSD